MQLRDQVPILCGDLQTVIAKLRQEGASFARLDGAQGRPAGAPFGARGLFCLREPGLFVDVLQVSKAFDLRKEAQALMSATCTARERLRACTSSLKMDAAFDPMEVLLPLLDIVRSPSMSATATGEALSVVHRVLVDLDLLERVEAGKRGGCLAQISDAVVECVFRQTESGDDEIAIMWALEVLEACLKHKASAQLPNLAIERLFVTVYKNSIASSNADMLRRLAVRKLASVVNLLFRGVYFPGAELPESQRARRAQLASQTFLFLCRRIDPHGGNWNEMDARQTCLELVLTAIVSTINPEDGRIMVDNDKEIHQAICNSLFRALLQICQVAGRTVDEHAYSVGFQDGSDMVKVDSMSSLSAEGGDDPHTPARISVDSGDSSQSHDPADHDLVVQHEPHPGQVAEGAAAVAARPAAGSASSEAAYRRIKDPFFKIPTTFATLERQSQGRGTRFPPGARAASPTPESAAGSGAGGTGDAHTDAGSAAGGTGGIILGGDSPAPFDSRVEHARMPLPVLSRALRVVHVLIAHSNTRQHLKVQIQAFYNSVFLRALEAKAKTTDNEARRLVLETLTDLFADPSLTIDLYCNYDCNLDTTNVYENLFVYLSNHSFPKQLRKLALDSLQLMSLRCIHIGVKAVANRLSPELDGVLQAVPDGVVRPEELRQTKLAKRQLMACVQDFNRKPKQGVASLVDSGIISDPPDPAQLASFLRNTQGLDKSAIGEFIGSTGDLNASVLSAFVATFEMHSLPLLAALRMFLESFRLPGEAQVIDRILQCFAERAHEECLDARTFPTVDCTYLLCFSIILLNTDLHNPNIRPEKKMTFSAFKLNNLNYGEEVSKGQDMPLPLLRSIYDEIKSREINTMSDGSSLTAEVTTDRWRDLLRNSSEMRLISPALADSATQAERRALFRIYDKHMFAAIHKPAIAALSVVYHAGDPSKQPKAVEMAFEGIMNCAEVSAYFGMVRVLDRITVDICKFTSLLRYAHASNSGNLDGEGEESGLDGADDDDDSSYFEDNDALLRERTMADDGNTTDMEEEDVDEERAGVDAADQPGDAPPKRLGRSESSRTSRGSRSPSVSSLLVSSPGGAERRSLTGDGPDVLGSLESIEGTRATLQATPKAQTATSAVFQIVFAQGKQLRQAWPHVLYCLLRLFDLGVLPEGLLRERASPGDAPAPDPALRLRYHRTMASTWLKDAERKLAAAREGVERTKGWVSWLSGESKQEAEIVFRARLDERSKVERAVLFASESLGVAPEGLVAPAPAPQIERIRCERLASLVEDTTAFSKPTLVAFVRGLLLACGCEESSCPSDEDIVRDVAVDEMHADDSDGDVRPDITVAMLSPASRASRLFGLHLLCEVALANVDRIGCVWGMVRAHLLRVIKFAKQATCSVEKASVGLLALSLRLVESANSQLAEDATSMLRFLLRLPQDLVPGFARLACDSIVRLVDSDKLRWNAHIERALQLVSQVDDYAVATLGAKLALPKLCGHQELLAVPTQDILALFGANISRAKQHLHATRAAAAAAAAASAGGQGQNDVVDLLDLLFIVHSRWVQSRDSLAGWFDADCELLELMAKTGLDSQVQVRAEAVRLLSAAFDELPAADQEASRARLGPLLAELDPTFATAPEQQTEQQPAQAGEQAGEQAEEEAGEEAGEQTAQATEQVAEQDVEQAAADPAQDEEAEAEQAPVQQAAAGSQEDDEEDETMESLR